MSSFISCHGHSVVFCVFFFPAIEKELRQQECGETTPLIETLNSTSAENDRIVTQKHFRKELPHGPAILLLVKYPRKLKAEP